MPTNDPEKQKQYRREYYHRNKDRILKELKEQRIRDNGGEYRKPGRPKINEEAKRAARRRYKKRIRDEALYYIDEYKKQHPCIRCGETHVGCLQFHHTDPNAKEGNVSALVKKGIKAVKEEIKKCDVLCANCHMKLHYEERQA